MSMEPIILFQNKKDCCGCSACMNICPKNAISMKADSFGYIYPHIDEALCIRCGACKKVCAYQGAVDKSIPKEAFAAAARDEEILEKSASGGIFSVFAEAFLEEKGKVFGAAMPFIDGKLEPKHIKIEKLEDLHLLQGSKYVQSEIGYSYQEVKKELVKGEKVLFSGTPCQIAGLKKYLNKDYENLLTMEVICHGVPSKQFFQDYIIEQEKRKKGSIVLFRFRDKSKKCGLTHYMQYMQYIKKDSNQLEEWACNGKLQSYVALFLKSFIHRENCYTCPYATKERCADLTIGDYWGFHKEYTDSKQTKNFSDNKGISCLLVNTEKGKSYLRLYQDKMYLLDSEFEKIARHNDQLIKPSIYHVEREEILSIYLEQGYAGIETYYKRYFKKSRLKEWIIGLIPKSSRRQITKIMTLFK